MKRILTATTALFFATALVACGGGETGQQTGEMEGGEMEGGEMAQQAAGQLTMPDWITVDEANETATLDIVAGETSDNNSWNYNGYYNGNATVVVPQGYEVTINFENADQVNPHSVGVDSKVGGYPSVFEEVTPAFEGAVTSGATEMSSATQPGESETITFTAGEAGEYALVCYVPAHATAGMWIHFEVSAEGEAGLRTGGGS